MLRIMALGHGNVSPEKGSIAVTGAVGGVGKLRCVPARGSWIPCHSLNRPTRGSEYLRGLGAAEIIPRSQLASSGKPLAKQRWIGAVDTVGGQTLENLCAATHYGGTVAACGLAGSMEFPGTVAPFILRGVTLAGVDSVYCQASKRATAWARLSSLLEKRIVDRIARTISLKQVIQNADDVLAGMI